jgi:hypothetical protein
MDHGVPNVFAVLKRGGCPSEIVMQYNKWSMTFPLLDN